MDLAGLVSILENNALWFSKVGVLSDRHEGVIPQALVTYRDEADEDGQFTIDQERSMNAAELVLYSRSMILVNCWHQSDCESAAMWAIYGTDRGFAVSTTVDRLCAALDLNQRDLNVDCVGYVDYAAPDPILIKMPWLMKRSAFAYEREIRVWTNTNESRSSPQGVGDLANVDISMLIESLYLSPRADAWLQDIVTKLLRRYSVSANVIPSTLYAAPNVPLPSRYKFRFVQKDA